MSDDVLVGRYRRVRALGSGGMGEVWLAEDLELGRHVAVKRLLASSGTADPGLVERMTREARMVARLRHPAIVALHDLVRVEGRPYLVMEYVEGESLADRLAREGTMAWAEVASPLAEVAGALDAAHAAGVLHRDVKPANILLDAAGHAHLADFGIARAADDASMTRTGELMGTVAFMAPDIARAEPAGPPSDVWSLGATFFTAVEGHVPFGEGVDSVPAMIARLITQDAPPARRAGGATGLVARMLATDPSARPTAAEAAAELVALAGLPGGSRPAEATGATPLGWETSPATPGELPAGTVTLLFSDMEGSTAMVRELGPAWPEVLDRQRELCRAAWGSHGGHELGTEGDSFLVAFATAEAGVAAALGAQRAIAAQAWPAGATVRVRMGLHTRSPQRHGDGYVGLDVHKSARVAAAAHGGQVLVTEQTARLAQPSLADGDRLTDLGAHRLRDIPGRHRILQVSGSGLAAHFPPIRSQGAPGSLPAASGPVLGRDDEIDELEALVRGGARAITLTGPGGTGKTTLATALARRVADDFFDGVYLVPLAAATRAEQMWGAVAQLLDVPADGHVPPGFFDYVGDRTVLLVLDNLEQIGDADAMIRTLLEHAHHVTVVATSRRPLHVPGEVDFAVAPLPLATGTDLASAEASPAVALFVHHAARVRRGFALDAGNAADVVALCAALDGLPLAIELAAARAKMLSPRALLQRIDQALDLASTDRSRDDRQRTLRGAVAWSYDLLDPAHQAVLDHLGVFAGGASVEALEAVVPPDALDGTDLVDALFDLVNASLVRAADDDRGEPRFGLLETVRRFALDRLEASGRLVAARAAHATFFHRLAGGPLLDLYGGDYRTGRQLFLREFDNLGVVVARGGPGVTDPDSYGVEPVPSAHVVRTLAVPALLYRRYSDGLHWLESGLGRPGTDSDPVGLAALLAARARLLRLLGRPADALADVTAARAVLDGDPAARTRPAGSLVSVDRTLANLCFDAGHVHAAAGDAAQAAAEAIRALETGVADPELQRQALELAFLVAYYAGDFDRAREVCLELAYLDASSGSAMRAAVHQNDLADLDLQQGRPADARRRLAAASEQILAVGDPDTLIISTQTFCAAIADVDPLLCARAYGAVHHAQATEGVPNDDYGEEEDRRVLERARSAADPAAFDAAYAAGAGASLVDLFREMAARSS